MMERRPGRIELNFAAWVAILENYAEFRHCTQLLGYALAGTRERIGARGITARLVIRSRAKTRVNELRLLRLRSTFAKMRMVRLGRK